MKYRTEYNSQIIGMNLRRLRKKMGLTIEQVRQHLRLGSVQAIYKYEAGKSIPPGDTMLALMELYNASVRDIVGVAQMEIRLLRYQKLFMELVS